MKGGIQSMASKNSLDDVFKTMRQYQKNNSGAQTSDQSTSAEPKVNSTPSINQIEIPKTAKQSKVQRLLSHLPFIHSPKRNLIYGIGGTVLAIGLVLAAFHAIVSPTAPNSNGDRSPVSVTQSEKQHSGDHQKSVKKKTESHQKKSDEKQSKQKKQESKKPEQKKQESKKPEQKKSQPARQQATQSHQTRQSNRSAQHQVQPARQQTAQSHRSTQPARQQAAQPSRNTQRQSQPTNNGGWSMNNGGQSSNAGAGSDNGTMSDGVYDGWDDDSRVGIYDADGNLVN